VPRSHIRRPIVVLPPRHLISIACPAWCLGHDLSAQIICVSYAQTLPTKHRAHFMAVFSKSRLFPQPASVVPSSPD
jgi:hypothetical protein